MYTTVMEDRNVVYTTAMEDRNVVYTIAAMVAGEAEEVAVQEQRCWKARPHRRCSNSTGDVSILVSTRVTLCQSTWLPDYSSAH